MKFKRLVVICLLAMTSIVAGVIFRFYSGSEQNQKIYEEKVSIQNEIDDSYIDFEDLSIDAPYEMNVPDGIETEISAGNSATGTSEDRNSEVPVSAIETDFVKSEKTDADKSTDITEQKKAVADKKVVTARKPARIAKKEQRKKPGLPGISQKSKSSAESESDNLWPFLPNKVAVFSEGLSEAENGGDYLIGESERLAKEYVTSGLQSEVSGWLNKYGTAEFSVFLDDKWQLDQFDMDYLLPLYGDNNQVYFTQLGATRWQDRNLVSLGAGYRRLFSDYILGANLFYDQDLTYGHKRSSVGLEARTRLLRAHSNYYFPLSGWRYQSVGNKNYNLEARAARGFDLKVTGLLPAQPQVSGSVEYFKWFGNKVDFPGNFHNDATDTGELWQKMGSDPQGVNLSIGWQPVSLLSTELTRTIGSEDVKDTRFSVAMTYNLDEAIERQLATSTPDGENLLSQMKTALVDRDKRMFLEYRANSNVPMMISPGAGLGGNITAGAIKSLQMNVQSPLPIVRYQWQDSCNLPTVCIEDKNKKEPAFIAPAYKKGLNNSYNLKLTATDIDGRSVSSSDITFNVLPGNFNIEFFDKAGKTEADKVDIANGEAYVSKLDWMGNDGATIYWKVAGLAGSQSAATGCTAELGCSFRWEDNNKILKVPTAEEPTVKGDYKEGAGTHDLKLVITIGSTVYDAIAVPVEISADGVFSDAVFEKTKIEVNYKKGLTVSNPLFSDIFKDSTEASTEYSVNAEKSEPGVAEILDKTKPVVQVKKNGIAVIQAIHKYVGDKLFQPTEMTYTLTVGYPDGDITWDSDRVVNGVVTLDYPIEQEITIAAIAPEGGNVTYSVRDAYPAGFMTVDGNGRVVVKQAGEGKVCATASYGYAKEAPESCYTLIAEIENGISWDEKTAKRIEDGGGKIVMNYPEETELTVQATDSNQGNITYEKRKDSSNIITVGPTTGKITVNEPAENGQADICAVASYSSGKESVEQCFNLVVLKASDDVITWDDETIVVTGKTVTYGDDDNIFTESASAKDETKLTYIIKEGSSTKVAGISDASTGEVKVKWTGTTDICAVHESGLQSCYQLTVDKGVFEIEWKNAALNGLGPDKTYTGKLPDGGHDSRLYIKNPPLDYTFSVEYRTDLASYASFSGEPYPGFLKYDNPTPDNESFTITAGLDLEVDPNNELYEKAEISYLLKIERKIHPGLTWDDNGQIKDGIVEGKVESEFTIPARGAYFFPPGSSRDGALTYSANVSREYVFIDPEGKGTVYIHKQPESDVIITADQEQGDAYEASDPISYTIKFAEGQKQESSTAASNPSIVWGNRLSNGQLTKFLGQDKNVFTLKASASDKSKLTYMLRKGADSSVAGIDGKTGQVKVYKTGETSLCAVSYASRTARCVPLVVKVAPVKVEPKWKSARLKGKTLNKPHMTKLSSYGHDSSVVLADPGLKAKIVYSSSAPQVASIDNTVAPGIVQYGKEGTAVISARITSPTGQFQPIELSYKVIVENSASRLSKK